METVALTIVHDLRNPLSAIHAAAEMLMTTELSQPQMQRLVRNMYLASTRSQEQNLDAFRGILPLGVAPQTLRGSANWIAAAIARVSPGRNRAVRGDRAIRPAKSDKSLRIRPASNRFSTTY